MWGQDRRRMAIEKILLEHGSGGQATSRLLEEVILPVFGDVPLLDSAILETQSLKGLAFTTDSFVVDPIFFPGGDIGSLAVHGTVNDLAMVGATPLFLSVALILEEGLEVATLRKVLSSLAQAAREAGVRVICGDTKVVPRGKGDKVFINTTGLGRLNAWRPAPKSLNTGDKVIVSGPIADHGLTILAAREGLGLEGLKSDSQALHRVVLPLLEEYGSRIKLLRDPTRGGLASVLHEFAAESGRSFRLEEEKIPVRPEVRAGCEILGLDPLYLACEGRFVAVCAPEAAEEILAFLKGFAATAAASLIGEVVSADDFPVLLETRVGGLRPVPPLSGEPLPRIC